MIWSNIVFFFFCFSFSSIHQEFYGKCRTKSLVCRWSTSNGSWAKASVKLEHLIENTWNEINAKTHLFSPTLLGKNPEIWWISIGKVNVALLWSKNLWLKRFLTNICLFLFQIQSVEHTLKWWLGIPGLQM